MDARDMFDALISEILAANAQLSLERRRRGDVEQMLKETSVRLMEEKEKCKCKKSTKSGGKS
jgi:hypothetical protein